jgi:hypothetical protein
MLIQHITKIRNKMAAGETWEDIYGKELDLINLSELYGDRERERKVKAAAEKELAKEAKKKKKGAQDEEKEGSPVCVICGVQDDGVLIECHECGNPIHGSCCEAGKANLCSEECVESKAAKRQEKAENE